MVKKKRPLVKAKHSELNTLDPPKSFQKPKLKYSNYYMTINSNKSTKNIDKDKFVRRIRRVFDKIDKHIKFKDPKYSLDDIESIKVSTHPEIGGKYNQLHMHALLRIRHRAQISLPYAKLKEAIRKSGAVGEGFHFYSKLVKDNKTTLKDYMNKTKKRKLEADEED